MEPGSEQNRIFRDGLQYQGYDSDESDDDVLSVEPLLDAASWDGAELSQWRLVSGEWRLVSGD